MSSDYKLGKYSILEDYCQIGIKPNNYTGSKITAIGNNAHIRSHTVIYIGNLIGNNFQTGHGVLIREDNKIGENVSVGSHSVIEHHVTIGNNVRIHSNSFIPEYTVLEDDSWIGPQVTFTNSRYPASANAKKNLLGVTIGQKARIGAGSVILPGVSIGKNSLIGAGSVVTKDIPENSVAVGNPAKVIKKISFLRNKDNTLVYP